MQTVDVERLLDGAARTAVGARTDGASALANGGSAPPNGGSAPPNGGSVPANGGTSAAKRGSTYPNGGTTADGGSEEGIPDGGPTTGGTGSGDGGGHPPGRDRPLRLLDVGCGEGRHMHAAALSDDAVEVVGVDIDRERLRRARADFETYVAPELADWAGGDGESSGDGRAGTADAGPEGSFAVGRADALSLPFPDGTFDAVVCSEVLEHLPDYERAVDELARVLRPGGHLGVSVPRYGPEAVCWRLSDDYHRTEGGHVRILRRGELESVLEARGLRLVGSEYAHALHSPYWWLKCLWWDRADDDPPLALSAYERFLEWAVTADPAVTRWLERALDPILGKSLVVYVRK